MKELAPQIEEYASVLEEFVLPFNKYTRRRCALKGSSLHLPGLVKAVLSNFTYKKFFSQKTAGGKRNYCVCLVVDVSASMNGHLAESTQESLFCLIAALLQSHVPFSILLFGQNVRLIKTEDQEWSPAVFWSLLCYSKKMENVSMDANAIDLAVELLGRSDGDKKVFVFTDGYGTCGLRLPLALERAEKQSVEVVGIAVGVDRTWVQHTFRRYIVAMVPGVLPQALRVLYLEEGTADASDLELDFKRGNDESVHDILATQERIFNKAHGDMVKAREANLVQVDNRPDVVTVDVAFCLDCTGSMSAWIAAAKGQILTIAKDIGPRVKKDFPQTELEIRFAVVAYRDYGDSEQIDVWPADHSFSTDADAFCTRINSLVARGGTDGPEDLLGALHTAGALQWQSKLKFLVIVTDSPAHGADCNDDTADRYRDGDPDGRTMASVIKPIADKKIDLMFCRIKKTNTEKTEKAMQRCYNSIEHPRRKLAVLDLFKADEEEAKRFHFVFCLDESGSMGGTPWQALLTAYAGFLNKRRNDQGADDLVSVVTFGSGYTIQHKAVSILSVSGRLDYHGGGTNFDQALQGAVEVLSATPQGAIPMLVFMSDGHGSGTPVPTISSLRQQYPGFVCNCVGLGSADMDTLREMSDAGNGQTWTSEMDTIAAVFGEIAAGCAALDGMVTQFGERIAEMVSERICLDHM